MDNDLESKALFNPDEQLSIRIAWYYYITEMTQQQIADRFNVSRARVNKALANCRETGVVQIRINSKLASCVRLEHELQARYGLHEAIVVPVPPGNGNLLYRVLGAGAGPYFHDQLFEGCSVGVGWGRTLRHTVRQTRGRTFARMTLVSLMGGLNHGSGYNTIEIAHSLARLFNGEYYYLAAPVYMDTAVSRDTLLDQESLRNVYQRAQKVDMAMITVGDLSCRSLMLELGLIRPEDARALCAAGAVGDLLGHYLDADGREVDHPLNQRVIALSLEDLARIRKVILVSGGADKTAIIRAVLRRGLIHVLIVDEATAQQLTADPTSE